MRRRWHAVWWAALLVGVCVTSAGRADADVSWSRRGGLRFSRNGLPIQARLGAVLMLDGAAAYGNDATLADDFEVRRARVSTTLSIYEDWLLRLTLALEQGEVGYRDAWLAYRGVRNVTIKVGQFQEPFSLEELTGAAVLTFMERALPNELAPGYHLGAGAQAHGRWWNAAGGVFGGTLDDDSLREAETGWGMAVRLTAAPLRRPGRVVHLGVAEAFRAPDQGGEVRFRARPEAHLIDSPLVDSGTIRSVDYQFSTGLEAAVQLGAWLIQGEYLRTDVERDAGHEPVRVHGWYVFTSWLVGAPPRPYDVRRGGFGRVDPRARAGALELGARGSSLDLTDAGERGNEAIDVTLGVNWYPVWGVRLMFNWVHVGLEDPDGDERFSVFEGRLQVEF